MPRLLQTLLILSVSLGVTGCKVVKDTPEGEKEIAADASGDDARTQQRILDTYESQLIPYISQNAVTIQALKEALSNGLDAAGTVNGVKSSGGAWNVPVSGTGTIVATKLDSRARTVSLDMSGDQNADVTVQLGPVVKGTALRDVAPFYKFDDFRDQIEFAKLGRALNDRASAELDLPEGDILGQTMRFTGVTTFRRVEDALVVTPIQIEITP